mmetsp:Transcript_70056/g.130955  ORF Transcript_70056/g.130955 Transcript_70056/m.130955 type:complete len:214 (+) Transcript_70056:61-702(+)
MTSPLLGREVEARLSPPSTPVHSWWSSVARNSPSGTISLSVLTKSAASQFGKYPPAVWPATSPSPPRTPELRATRNDTVHLPGNALDSTSADVLASFGSPQLTKNHFTQSWTGPLSLERRKMWETQSLPVWPGRPAGRSTLEKEHPTASGFLAHRRFHGTPVPWQTSDGLYLLQSGRSGEVKLDSPHPHLLDLRRPRRSPIRREKHSGGRQRS